MANIFENKRRTIVITAALALAVGLSIYVAVLPSLWHPLVESSMPQYGISSKAPVAMSDVTDSLGIDKKELQHAKFMGCKDNDGMQYYMGVYDFTGEPCVGCVWGLVALFLNIYDTPVSTKNVTMCGLEFKETISKRFSTNDGGMTRIHLTKSRAYFFIIGSRKMPVESILYRAERYFRTVKIKVE